MIDAINYQNWYYKESRFQYELKETEIFSSWNLSSTIPVGSVEFVQSFIKHINPVANIRPINIPDQLMYSKFLGRRVYKNCFDDISGTLFVKDNSKIKGISDFVNSDNAKEFIKYNNLKEYIVSESIKIKSEWRGFVYRNELVDLRNYSGAFDIFPDVIRIREMVATYKDCPPAYTIDVAVTETGTFLIECHNFFSCGLYGFSDYTILPNMLVKAFKWQLENLK